MTDTSATSSPNGATPAALRFSTDDVPAKDRGAWWREVICRQYAEVDITSPVTERFGSDVAIYPWGPIRLSRVHSSEIALSRLPGERGSAGPAAYLAVLPLSGEYRLEQDGREAVLHAGDMAIYDASRPHRIRCPSEFSTLIVSVPRPVMRDRIAAAESCVATRIPGDGGVGAVASAFLRAAAGEIEEVRPAELGILADSALDLLTLAVASVRPMRYCLSRSQSHALYRVKRFVGEHLHDPGLDAGMIARQVGLSDRYVRKLFESEGTSPGQYILDNRLDQCRRDLENRRLTGRSVSEIAFRWGFNDLSHFSRRFRERFGVAPRTV